MHTILDRKTSTQTKPYYSVYNCCSYILGLKQSELPALDEEDDNPYHPQRLLKVGILNFSFRQLGKILFVYKVGR